MKKSYSTSKVPAAVSVQALQTGKHNSALAKLFGATLIVVGSIIFMPHAHAAECVNMYDADTVTPSGYGLSWNPFSASRELLLSGVDCTPSSVTFRVGNGATTQYVYEYGYVWNGSMWDQVKLKPNSIVDGQWLEGSADATVPAYVDGTHVAAYVCTYVPARGTWHCGCTDAACTASAWQLQTIVPATAPLPPAQLEVPPVLSPDALIVEGVCPEDTNWPSRTQMAGRDVYISLPTDRVCKERAGVGGTTSNAAHNVVVVGGEIDFYSADITGTAAISVANWDGTAFIEGVALDLNNSCNDGVRTLNAKGEDARIVIQNSYIRGMGYCTPIGTHGDLYHAQTGLPVVKEALLQNVRGELINQGIFVPYRESGHGVRRLTMDHVELALDPRFKFVLNKISTMIFAGPYADPINLFPPDGQAYHEVYLNWWNPWYPGTENKTNIVLPTPDSFDEHGCAVYSDALRAEAQIEGTWCKDTPDRVPFVPVDKVGRLYDRAYFTGTVAQ